MDKKNIAWFSIGPIISAGLSFLVVPLSTWLFTKEDIGKVALLLSISGFTTLILSLGLDQAYVREYHEDKNRPSLLFNSFFPGAIIGIILIILLFISSPSFLSNSIFEVESIFISTITGIYFLILFFTRFFTLSIRMDENGKNYSFSHILPKIATSLGLIILGLFVESRELIHLVLIYCLALIVNFLFLFYANRLVIKKMLSNNVLIDLVKIKKMLHFGLPLTISGMLFWGIEGVDKMMLKMFSTYEELGIYSVALNVSSVATIFTSIFTTIWIPVVYRWIAEKSDLQKIDYIINNLLLGSLLIISLSGLLSWLPPLLLPEGYEIVSYLFPICMLWPLFYALSEATGIGIAVCRKTSFSFYVASITLVCNLLLNLLFIPILGAKGAAISLAVSFWIFFILRTEFSCKIWRNFERKSLYIWSLIILIMTTSFLLYGDIFYYTYLIIWFLFLIIIIFFFRNLLTSHFLSLKYYIKSLNLSR